MTVKDKEKARERVSESKREREKGSHEETQRDESKIHVERQLLLFTNLK